ncbi:MAG: ubiquitin-protein ligase [Actinomycetia bacterium]|nr:ubiquitin-protein ligase [Actinomycetes bacterium]
MTPRDQRLVNEAALLRAAFSGSPVVEVSPVGWDPYETYRLVYTVPGVVLERGLQPRLSRRHSLILELGPDYPRLAPRVVTDSAVFHPNLGAVIGDAVVFDREWTAARTLIDVVVRVGQMLQYQAFDVAEPANTAAANWARRNAKLFPVGRVDIDVRIPEETPSADDAPAVAVVAVGDVAVAPVSDLRV